MTIHKHEHFSARELCSGDDNKFKTNANMCASEGIIGPISDYIHITEEEDGEEIPDDAEFFRRHLSQESDLDIPSISSSTHNEAQIVENLYFFTDMDEFSSHRFEYLSPTEATKGFVFALFVPDKDWDGYGYGFDDNDYDHLHTSVSNTLQGLSEHNMDVFMSKIRN